MILNNQFYIDNLKTIVFLGASKQLKELMEINDSFGIKTIAVTGSDQARIIDKSIKVNIFDVNGRLIDNLYDSVIAPGNHQLVWHPTNKASGIYFVLLESPGLIKTQKLVLMK